MSNWKNLIRKEDSTYEMHDKTEQSYEQIRELFEEAIKIANGITNRTKEQVNLVRFLERILTEGD